MTLRRTMSLSLFAGAALLSTSAVAQPSGGSRPPRPGLSATPCTVTVYEHSHYEGASQVVSLGELDLDGLTIGNDVISSLKVSPGCTATLYEHGGFQGQSIALTGDVPWVGDGWNDITSGIRVRRGTGAGPGAAAAAACAITIFEHANYEGASQVLAPGSYDMAQLTIGNDVISSAKIPTNCTVTVYEHAGFNGESRAVTADMSYVGDDWNDRVSSIRVQ